MSRIINNNMMPKSKNKSIYIKSVVLTEKEFWKITENIDKRYNEFQNNTCHFETFYSWALLAMILGIFTSHGNPESTSLFLNCLKYNYLPKFLVKKHNDNIKVCICIKQKELNERIAEFKNIRK